MAASLRAVKFSYYASALFSLTVLVLSLLDFGFISLFLDIVAPLSTLIHHITLYIIHRRRQGKAILLPSTLPSYCVNVTNLTLLCLLALLWTSATGLVSFVASSIWNDDDEILWSGVPTRASVISQAVFAAIECALLWGMFGIGVHERKRSRVGVIPLTDIDKSGRNSS